MQITGKVFEFVFYSSTNFEVFLPNYLLGVEQGMKKQVPQVRVAPGKDIFQPARSYMHTKNGMGVVPHLYIIEVLSCNWYLPYLAAKIISEPWCQQKLKISIIIFTRLHHFFMNMNSKPFSYCIIACDFLVEKTW